jgi:hypothetical protein
MRTEPSDEVLAQISDWKKEARVLKILFVGAENSAMRGVFDVEFEMEGKLTGFDDRTLNAIIQSGSGTSSKLRLRDCRFEVLPGPSGRPADRGLKIQFSRGETCLVGVRPSLPR